MAEPERMYFVDNLKVALTVLVIAHHVGQAYGPTGGWWPIQESARADVLGPLFTVNRSFFMSLFFLISGYLMVGSYDRHGPAVFLKSRLLRLGAPLVLFFFLVIPVEQYLCHRGTTDVAGLSFARYYVDFYFGFGQRPAGWRGPAWPELNFGHLWYVEHLLILSSLYALLRVAFKRPMDMDPAERGWPGNRAIVLFALVVAVASAVVRIWYPIDRWTGLLGFIQVAFADVPRDLGFFIVGVIAYRGRWFVRFPTRVGMIWLWIGVTAAALWFGYALALRHVFPIGPVAMGVVYPVWETLLCCGMCIGLLVWFRERFDRQGPRAKAMARSQYAAYVFHMPVVILLQFAVLSLDLPPLVKFFLVTAAAVPATFLLSDWIRRPAFVRRVL